MSRSRNKKPKAHGQINLGSFLVNWGARLAFLIVVVVIVLSLVQCTVKKPEAPQWDTQLTIPIVNRTYHMAEIVRKIDQDGIYMDADSNVMYEFSRDLDTFAIDADNLSTEALTCDVSGHIGTITVDPPAVDPVSTNANNISGLPGVYPAVIPAGDFQVPISFPPLSGIGSADIDQGSCYFVITNSLGIDIDAATVILGDLGLGSILATQAFAGGVLNGETDSILVPLDGRSISNSLAATINCHTPGGVVNNGTSSTITCAVRFPAALQVSSAVASVPAFDRSYADSVSLQESNLIANAAISGGSLQITLSNDAPLPATLTVTVPDLQNNGTPLVLTRTVAANSTANASASLTGYELVPSDATVPQLLSFDIEAAIAGSGGSMVSINESNGFAANASISPLSFSSVTGVFSNLTATIDPIVCELDVPDGFDSLQFSSAILTLEIENSMNVPGSLSLSLEGSNGKSLSVDGAINARTLATAATTVLVEPDVAPFFSPVPEQVTISGTASFGSGVSGTIRDGDYITGRVTVEAPLEVIIKETPITSDIESEEIDQEDIDEITDRVTEARFVYNIINHLPIGATVNIVINPDSASLYTAPALRFDDISVDAAPVAASVVTDTLSTGYQTIALSAEDIQVLKNDILYIGYEIVLHDSNGQPVRLTNNDFLSVIGRIEVEYRFDGEF